MHTPDTHTPPAGWPTIDQVEGPFVRPNYAPPRTAHGIAAGPAPDAITQDPDGTPVPLYRHPPQPQPATAPPPTAQKDPWPARIVAVGVAAPGVGAGGWMLFGAIAGATTALGLIAACLALALILRGDSGRQGAVNVNVTVNSHNKTRRR